MDPVNDRLTMSSQRIGREHEERVEHLLQGWKVPYQPKKKVHTDHDGTVEIDFWLPGEKGGVPTVIECKTFGVKAKRPADSQRRKVQEALRLLVQLRRHCSVTKGARIVVVTGSRDFSVAEKSLLSGELGPEFHVVSVDHPEALRRRLGLERTSTGSRE